MTLVFIRSGSGRREVVQGVEGWDLDALELEADLRNDDLFFLGLSHWGRYAVEGNP